MRGVVLSLPNTPSWRGAYSSTRKCYLYLLTQLHFINGFCGRSCIIYILLCEGDKYMNNVLAVLTLFVHGCDRETSFVGFRRTEVNGVDYKYMF
jgi:hypothetical protein